MHVERILTLRDFASLEDEWHELAPVSPTLSWQWLYSWWRHYGVEGCKQAGGVELYLLTVRDADGGLVAVAPWFREWSPLHGHVIRFLGTGEVCSDYLSILCRVGAEQGVVAAVAEWMLDTDTAGRDSTPDHWDLLDWTSIDAADRTMQLLAAEFARRGAIAHCRHGERCWRLELPASWDEYLERISKTHRKRVRRLVRDAFDQGRAQRHVVRNREDLDRGLTILNDLHDRLWQSRGSSGAFSNPRIRSFHREVVHRHLASGQLRLSWLEFDRRPISAEYQLTADGVVYAYQSGMEPDCLDLEPGTLSMIASIRSAIDEGFRALDLMRGDEPYKAHWRAEPRPTVAWRIVPGNTKGWLRHNAWVASNTLKQWLRAGRDFVTSS